MIPIAAVLSGVVDFAIAFVVLIGMMVYSACGPTANVVWLPLLLLLALVTALGVGLWLSALNVQYRDVRYIVPFLVQFWLFGTPIAYPSSLLAGAVADALRHQPDGRRGRRVPLGVARHRRPRPDR